MVHEGSGPDRAYENDGSMVSRQEAPAPVLHDARQIAERVVAEWCSERGRGGVGDPPQGHQDGARHRSLLFTGEPGAAVEGSQQGREAGAEGKAASRSAPFQEGKQGNMIG